MPDIAKGIESICTLLFNFSNMDTCFIDHNSQIKVDYGYNLIPTTLQPYYGQVNDILNIHQPNSEYNIFFHETSHKTNFITAKVYHENNYLGSIILGPYLVEDPSLLMIETVLFENNLSISLKHLINQYYSSLPLITPYKAKLLAKSLASSLANLSSFSLDDIDMGRIRYDFQSESAHIPNTLISTAERPTSLIKETYEIENKLMEAVQRGDKSESDKLSNEFLFLTKDIPDRAPQDVLRSRKNISFVLNTILRKAAEKGGLDLIKIHSISEKFAIQIEKTTSIQSLLELQKKMVTTYCNDTYKYSLKDYNYTTRKAIEYIRIKLDQDLSLGLIANALNINPYQLSREFKKETGSSITEYINTQRINESLYLLENQAMSITDTAYAVGFNDLNYFTKVFKKTKGLTPSQYRKNKL